MQAVMSVPEFFQARYDWGCENVQNVMNVPKAPVFPEVLLDFVVHLLMVT